MSDTLPNASHPELALAADHALDLLDGAERAAYEAHLATCAECRAEVRALRETGALLAHAAPAAAPPPALRARVLAEARAASTPPVRDLAAARETRETREARRAPSRTQLPWLAAAAAALLAVGLGARWRGEAAARAAAEQALVSERTALARSDSLLAALLAPDVRIARLTATGAAPEVRVFWNRGEGVVVLTAASLPAPRAGRTYQLWGIATGGKPQSLGTFASDATGRARVVLRVPATAAMDLAAITDEPAGGSPQPTSAPFLAGPIAER